MDESSVPHPRSSEDGAPAFAGPGVCPRTTPSTAHRAVAHDGIAVAWMNRFHNPGCALVGKRENEADWGVGRTELFNGMGGRVAAGELNLLCGVWMLSGALCGAAYVKELEEGGIDPRPRGRMSKRQDCRKCRR